MGVETHAQLCGYVTARVAISGTTAVAAPPVQNAAALFDLRMVQTLFQATQVSPRGRAALRGPRRHTAGSWFVRRIQETHGATTSRRG